MRSDLPLANVLEVGEDDDLLATLGAAAEGRAAIGVAGGDGSGAAGAQVALQRDLPLLVVPAGTLNHLARDLRIDRKTEAIDAYRAGEAVAIDVGDADGELFVNTLTFGAYPEMIERRERLQSRIGRWPAHVIATARAIFAADPLEVWDPDRPIAETSSTAWFSPGAGVLLR